MHKITLFGWVQYDSSSPSIQEELEKRFPFDISLPGSKPSVPPSAIQCRPLPGPSSPQGSISCSGGHELVDKCFNHAHGWANTVNKWMECSRRNVDTLECANYYNHVGHESLACVICCKGAASQTLCECDQIHNKETFTKCQKQMECHLGNPSYSHCCNGCC